MIIKMANILIKRYLESSMDSVDEELLENAAKIRKKYNSNVLTYSKNIFIPLTYYCRNNCSYCNFRRSEGEFFFSEKEFAYLAVLAAKSSAVEVLFTQGERPEEKYPEIQQYLERKDYESTVEYLEHYCKKALIMGLLPHSNPGITSIEDMKRLKSVNASQGLMLENVSNRLTLSGMPHHLSPGKKPNRRIKAIENAGKLQIPFTSGLLIGIGESADEVIKSLYCLKDLHDKYGHLQEVIIQHYKEDRDPQTTEDERKRQLVYLVNTIALAKDILGEIPVQSPPNLSGIPDEWLLMIKAGISDFGGISALTVDHVNPSSSWPSIDVLKQHVGKFGFNLVQRLPVYPRYINNNWLSGDILKTISDFDLVDKRGYFNIQRNTN